MIVECAIQNSTFRGADLYYLLRRLEVILFQDPEHKSSLLEDPGSFWDGTNRAAPLFVQLIGLRSENNGATEMLWACPGVTNYILGHDLISPKMMERKNNGLLPTARELESENYTVGYQLHPLFCNLMCLFATFSAIRDVNTRDRSQIFRGGSLLAGSATRRCMTWWTCPYSRASIPQRQHCLMTPRKLWFLVLTECALSSDWQSEWSMKRNEIIPGLSVKGFYDLLEQEAIMWQFLSQATGSTESLYQGVRNSLNRRASAWGAFSVSQRAEVIGWLIQRSYPSRHALWEAQRYAEMAAGADDVSLWLKVAKTSSKQASRYVVKKRDKPNETHSDSSTKWLNKILCRCRPSVLCFLEHAARSSEAQETPEEVIELICEFCVTRDMCSLPDFVDASKPF